ncbi:MAG: RNA polymerase sigma factor [Desulfobacterales bacterium]|nr:RNA polymerase sigma factor [Desulfobacterales bacterium]
MDDDKIRRLIQKAINNDNSSIESLIHEFHLKIFRMVYYRTRSKIDSDDITQDVFIKMMKNIKNLRQPEKFSQWLYKIAINTIRDFYRKKFLYSIISLSYDIHTSDDDPDAPIIAKEFWIYFEKMKKKLSKMEAEIFMLRFMDDLTIKEISEVLSKSESTIKTLLYRGIKKFQQNHEFIKLLGDGIHG